MVETLSPPVQPPDLMDPSLYINRELTWLEFNFRAKAVGHHFGDLDTASTNVCYCWGDRKFVHSAFEIRFRSHGREQRLPMNQSL